MTKALDAVLERIGRLPDHRQDEIASMIERIIDLEDGAARGLSSDHWLEIDRRLAGDRKFAKDEDVEAFFRAASA
ncbi:hypothetical protein IHQ68_01310 [Chelatococcus sambhunathii]|uniref:Addiction module component n=1 Tax=Chelatococcus sambhunathii TaxID=363953 RepID=A0ABU1DAX2_9HYPH|nr:hypothetical protein [Chelatococcus sambhunathii]MDR4305262.1 hypothetical protein [Chelatococcus sambhunathii]